jgi:hypothetical protein
MKRTFIALLAFVSLVFSAHSYSDGLNDAFSDAFGSATVQTGGSGTFELNGRTLHSAGYVRVRIPVVAAPNPVRFQAPGIKGGCNGFDIYGGSFSYISEQEILDWLNAVINNAGALATYMFITFLQEQCSVCSEVMQTLYAMQDMLNMTMQDSCTTATAMVDGVQGLFTDKETPSWDAYAAGVKGSAMNFSNRIEANYDDAVGALTDAEESTSNLSSAAIADAKDRALKLYGGNMLYWVVEETAALGHFRTLLGNSALTKDQLYAYLVTLVGNQVDFIEGTTDTQANTNGTHQSKVALIDFINGSFKEDTVPGKCAGFPDAGNFCMNPTDTTFKSGFADTVSFSEKFDCAMTGQKPDGSSCGSGVGLLAKLGRDQGVVGTLTADENAFLRDFRPGYNFGGMLASLSPTPALMSQFHECSGEELKNGFALLHMERPIDIVIKMLNGVDFGSGNGGTRKSAYLAYLEKRKLALNDEYLQLSEDPAGKSNCKDDAISRYLDFFRASRLMN